MFPALHLLLHQSLGGHHPAPHVNPRLQHHRTAIRCGPWAGGHQASPLPAMSAQPYNQSTFTIRCLPPQAPHDPTPSVQVRPALLAAPPAFALLLVSEVLLQHLAALAGPLWPRPAPAASLAPAALPGISTASLHVTRPRQSCMRPRPGSRI